MGLMFEPVDLDRNAPGCHAFIVGISAYPHLTKPSVLSLGLKPLPSAARSAAAVYDWIRTAKLAVPLASIRMLLSPVEEELLDVEASPCTLDNFIRDAYDWRAAAARNKSNLTLFYFVGHGFSPTQGEQLLVLQDFGDGVGPMLRNTVSVNNIVYGMAPDVSGEIARTQLYFIDANRLRLGSLPEYQTMNGTAVFDAPLRGIDDRVAPVFYATSPDAPAYTYSKAQTLFSQAMIEGLNGEAVQTTEDGKWCVSVLSLARYLPTRVQQLAAKGAVSQAVGVEGALGEAVISYPSETPLAEITVDFEPVAAGDTVEIEMLDGDGETIGGWARHGPSLVAKVPAGLYQIAVKGELHGTPFKKRKVLDARPNAANVFNVRVQ